MKKIVLISGGKDSTATLFKVLETHTPKEVIGLHCYTGWDSSITLNYIKELEDFTKVKIHYTKPAMSMLEIIKKYKPNLTIRKCTNLLKEIPTRNFIRQFREDILFFNGVRKDESSARNKRYLNINPDEIYEDKVFSIKKQKVYVQYPIINFNEEEVFKYIKENGFYPNPLYEMGYNRVGCFPCICGSIKELKLCMMDNEGRENIKRILEVLKDENWNEINRYSYSYNRIKKIYHLFLNQQTLDGGRV